MERVLLESTNLCTEDLPRNLLRIATTLKAMGSLKSFDDQTEPWMAEISARIKGQTELMKQFYSNLCDVPELEAIRRAARAVHDEHAAKAHVEGAAFMAAGSFASAAMRRMRCMAVSLAGVAGAAAAASASSSSSSSSGATPQLVLCVPMRGAARAGALRRLPAGAPALGHGRHREDRERLGPHGLQRRTRGLDRRRLQLLAGLEQGCAGSRVLHLGTRRDS